MSLSGLWISAASSQVCLLHKTTHSVGDWNRSVSLEFYHRPNKQKYMSTNIVEMRDKNEYRPSVVCRMGAGCADLMQYGSTSA